MEKLSFRLPPLKHSSLVRSYRHTYALRQGGVQLKHEVIASKHLFHAYGGGVSSTALAGGLGLLSAKSITIFLEDREAAVLGAGITGLTVALELAKRGKKVTVYSQSHPQEISPPAFWYPIDYAWDADLLKHELISKLSWSAWLESLARSRYQSLRACEVYEFDPSPNSKLALS